MERFNASCGIHEDWPACGCDSEVLTGADALDACCPYCESPECFGECDQWVNNCDEDNDYYDELAEAEEARCDYDLDAQFGHDGFSHKIETDELI